MKKTITAVTGILIAIAFSVMLFIDPDSAIRSLLIGNRNTNIEFYMAVSDEEGIVPGGFIKATVTRIVDGDTLEVKYEDDEYKVRLLCIDTPETKKSGVDVQPYGKQAADKLSEMVLNKKVTLVFEKDTDDRYDRLLAYIIVKDGSCVNADLVDQGYARVDIVRPNNVNEDYFYELQDRAIKEKRGLWSLPEGKRPFIKNDKGYYVPRYIDDAA